MPFYSMPKGGSPVLAGDGEPPAALGNVGDIYIDTTNSVLYGPKSSEGWGVGTSIGSGAGGVSSLSALSDTTITNVAVGDVLRYEAGRWRNYPDENLTDGGNY
jgi:hypothetical protein